MSTTFSFIGSYRFDSRSAIDAALEELREVLDEERDVPNPFTTQEIVIDATEVRFAISGCFPSDWFDFYDTITETFADHAQTGEVTVTSEDQVDIYAATQG